jgi:hypothetical protein
MKKRPKLEGCNNLQIGVKSILQKINPIKRINEKKKMDNGQPQDINKRQFIKKGLFGVGIGALAALLSKIPFARAVQNINYDNSANAMAVSSDGIIDMPNQSGCYVTRNTEQALTTSTQIKVEFATEVYDVQNEFDSTTNYRFTATKAGKYLVCAQLYFFMVSDGTGTACSIYKNGSRISLTNSRSGTSQSPNITAGVNLSASDYIEMNAWHNEGSDASILGGANYNILTINKIA